MRRISEISNSFTKMQVAVNEFLSKAYRLALSGGNGGKESLQTEKYERNALVRERLKA